MSVQKEKGTPKETKRNRTAPTVEQIESDVITQVEIPSIIQYSMMNIN